MTVFIDGVWRDTKTTPMLFVVDLDAIDIIADIGAGYGRPYFLQAPLGFPAAEAFHTDAMQKLETLETTIEALAGLVETKEEL